MTTTDILVRQGGGDALLKVRSNDTCEQVEVMSLASRRGIRLRHWIDARGEDDIWLSTEEALALAEAIIHAANTSQQFNDMCDNLRTNNTLEATK